ncbi:MAG: RNA-binding S4 domain-containing protein [Gammaproteobacteria bacterium]|nr:RNA-binding S4 domain-containing protein [Gammaproteobacteria bacterium]
MDKEKFSLSGKPFIELYKLLKVLGWCNSGGEAKTLIVNGQVKVNGEVELRKRCKIKQDQIVEFEGSLVEVMD